MARTGEQGGDVGAAGKEAEGHDGVGSKFPFVEEEETDGYDAEDEEADNDCGAPGVADAAVFEAEEEHDGATNDEDGSEPVDGFQTGQERGLGCFNVEEHHYDDKCKAVKGNYESNISTGIEPDTDIPESYG